MGLMNPTENGNAERKEQCFVIKIKYNPATGELLLGGNVGDPVIFHGVLKMAEVAWQKNAERNAASRIKIPSLAPRSFKGDH